MTTADEAQRQHRWLALPVAVVRKFGDDRGGHWAALVAFYGFFSLFPLLMIFVTLLGYVVRDDPRLQAQLLSSALTQFPVIGAQIETNPHAIGGSGWTLMVGLTTATWSGMRVVAALQGAMDEVWNVPRRDRPSFVRSRLEAAVMLLTLGIATVTAGLLAGIGATGTWVDLPLRVLAVAGTFAVNVVLFAAAFRLLTEADVAWRDVLPGAVVGAATWMALLVAGGWIVDRQIRNSTEIYGFFAVVIGLLAWLTIAANVVLLSAELNVVVKRGLWPRSLVDRPEATGPDRRVLAAEATEETARADETVDVRFR